MLYNTSWKLEWLFTSKSHILFLVLCFISFYMLPSLSTLSIFPLVRLLSYFFHLCALKPSAFYKLQSWLFRDAAAIQGGAAVGLSVDGWQGKAQWPELQVGHLSAIYQLWELALKHKGLHLWTLYYRLGIFSYFCICRNISCWNTGNCYENIKFMAKSSNFKTIICTQCLIARHCFCSVTELEQK